MPTGAEHGLVLSLDYIVGMPISAAGNTGGISVAEAEHDLGHFVPIKGRGGTDALIAFTKAIQQIFRRLPENKRRISRVHLDLEKAVNGGELHEYITDNGWWQTTTEGYDNNANVRVEGRNRQIRALLRPAMVTTTGGSSYGMSSWDELAMHASNTVLLNTPCAGDLSPVEKAGGSAPELARQSHVAGAKCVAYEAKERRDHPTGDHGSLGVWLGHSDTVHGGHRVSRVEWNPNKSEYIVHPTEDRITVKVDDDCMLMKKVKRKGDSEHDVSRLVDRFSSEAASSGVYEVKKILDHIEVLGGRE